MYFYANFFYITVNDRHENKNSIVQVIKANQLRATLRRCPNIPHTYDTTDRAFISGMTTMRTS